MKVTIKVDGILNIVPLYHSQKAKHMGITCEMDEDCMQYNFYKIWEKVEDDTLRNWLKAEGYDLVKSNN